MENYQQPGGANSILDQLKAQAQRAGRGGFSSEGTPAIPGRPEQPRNFEDAGISYRTLENLILKTIKQKGPQNEQQLSELIKLGANILHPIVDALYKRELLDTTQPLHYDLTTRGREITAMIERDDSYVGPAPVSLEDYCALCIYQAEQEHAATMAQVGEAFAAYTMSGDVQRELMEGFNSQRALLFFGPPGNGKSTITSALHKLLNRPVLLPHAFEFNGKVVQLYDPAFHRLMEDAMREEEQASNTSIGNYGRPDRRWLISRAPLVTVGTEFKVSHFEIAYDGQYSAPPHVKANNGVFILDDLGRQTEDHNMILNQFIFPLQEREAIVKFTGGSAMRVPYRQRLFLSTNLNHEEIIDDAFRRRLPYQLLVDRPTVVQWKEIFRTQAELRGMGAKLAAQMADALMQWYQEDGRIIRGSDPYDLLDKLAPALDNENFNAADLPLMKRIYTRFPAAYKRDAKMYVGALDSSEHTDT